MTPLALELVLVYVVIGVSVGAAATVTFARGARSGGTASLAGTGLAAVAFWPLFLPFLLAPSAKCDAPPRGGRPSPAPSGPLLQALRRTELSLDEALGGVDGRE